MSMSDEIADMLTRIRNAHASKFVKVACPFSKMKCSILDVLRAEGYISGYSVIDRTIEIQLSYSASGEPAIKELHRVSKPGRREYAAISTLKKYHNGLGVTILSTSHGVMSDVQARKKHVGGEIICKVF